MSLYDTRFFFELYYAKEEATLSRAKDERSRKGHKYVSAVTVHELYKLSLEREGREVAKLRNAVLVKEFTVIPVDAEVAVRSAEVRSGHRMPMADSIIAATAELSSLDCVTDDPHFARVKELKTRWIL